MWNKRVLLHILLHESGWYVIYEEPWLKRKRSYQDFIAS
jgi:hypothetical protein